MCLQVTGNDKNLCGFDCKTKFNVEYNMYKN